VIRYDRLPEYPRRYCIERIVLTATAAQAITAPEAGFLVDLVQDGDNGALDHLIFQGAHREGTLATVGFGARPTADGLCPIGPLRYPCRHVLEARLHVLPILLPRHPVHAWSRIPLERTVRHPVGSLG
jgi:hypothetical protein